jgi:hypothetical protein
MDEPVDVLYLMGKGRSGSTILGMALGELDGYFAAGEMRFFWQRGLIERRRCACGIPAPECEVWGAVAGLLSDIDPHEVSGAHDEVFRWTMAPRLLAGPRATRNWDALQTWVHATGRLVRAVARVTGARVVVDSSKWPTDPGARGLVPEVRPHELLLVRDPRAVAWSWQRIKIDPDTGQPRAMDRFGATYSAMSWTARNVVASLSPRGVDGPRLVLRYEDFIEDPAGTLGGIADFMGRPADLDGVLTGRTLNLGAAHAVAGNPDRFAADRVEIRPDDEWVAGLSRRDRLLVSALTWPLRGRFGYRP